MINSIFEIDCAKDERGFPIKGTGRALTKEEIKGIIKYMEDNGIPLYDSLFNMAVRRYANKTLDIGTLQEARN